MTQENVKGDFTKKLNGIAKELTQDAKSDKSRVFILLGSEILGGVNNDKEDSTEEGVVCIGGTGEGIINTLAKAFENEEVYELAACALKIATLKRI